MLFIWVEGLGSPAAFITFKPLAQAPRSLIGSVNHVYKVLGSGTEYVDKMYC